MKRKISCWSEGRYYYCGGVNFYLNSSTYDDFIKRDVTIQTIYDYFTKQTISAGTKDGFIKDTDKVKWTTGGSTNWLNSTIKDFRRRNTSVDKNCRLVINGNAFALTVEGVNPYFNVMRSDRNNIWPDLPN